MEQRVFVPTGGNSCVCSQYTVDTTTGNLYDKPCKFTGRTFDLSQVEKRGLPILSNATIKNAMAKNDGQTANYYAPQGERNQPEGYAVHGAVTASGDRTAVTLESARGGDTGLPFGKINLTLTNTSDTETMTVLIGDGAGFLSEDADAGGLGIPSTNEKIEVGGLWGENTLERIRQGAALVGYHFDSLFIQTTTTDGANDQTFYNSGSLSVARASAVGDSAQLKRVDLSTGVTQGAFNKEIRQFSNIGIHFDALRGLVAKIPPNVVLAMSFGAKAVGTGKVMESPH